MTQKIAGQELLENALQLSTPEDSITYYRSFAAHYESEFAQSMGYVYPAALAEVFHKLAEVTGPIADIGCGTGLVAKELQPVLDSIDGFDISPEMLAEAKQKNLYRDLYQVDLTGPLDRYANVYGAVISAGTFTFGHLGPEPLRNLWQIAKPGGRFIIGVNQVHFKKQNFAAVLDELLANDKISDMKTDVIKIYDMAGHPHSDDQALILQYRKI